VPTASPPKMIDHSFHTFVLKIHSRCDLACTYCYMYQSFDQGWRTQPRRMQPVVLDWTARRIAEHVQAHRLPEINVVLHGGEPLLAGLELITFAVETIRAATGPGTRVNAAVQTNGLRLSDAYLDVLAGLGVTIGISLDGTPGGHDRHRRRHDGSGSHARVVEVLHRLVGGPHRRLFSGLLCTIDVQEDPVETYEALLVHRPPMVDLLLPHGNWSSPPPGLIPGSGRTPYADWLIAVFDRWFDAPVQETQVRVFREIINLLLGGRARVEGLGLEPLGYLVIETDGGISQSDALRTAYAGAARLPRHVARDSFEQVLREPSIVAQQIGLAALAESCQTCELHRICGGGNFVHRYREGSGFTNPSVYCADLYGLIQHVRRRLGKEIEQLRKTLPVVG
jgi:uncharacterized protein